MPAVVRVTTDISALVMFSPDSAKRSDQDAMKEVAANPFVRSTMSDEGWLVVVPLLGDGFYQCHVYVDETPPAASVSDTREIVRESIHVTGGSLRIADVCIFGLDWQGSRQGSEWADVPACDGRYDVSVLETAAARQQLESEISPVACMAILGAMIGSPLGIVAWVLWGYWQAAVCGICILCVTILLAFTFQRRLPQTAGPDYLIVMQRREQSD